VVPFCAAAPGRGGGGRADTSLRSFPPVKRPPARSPRPELPRRLPGPFPPPPSASALERSRRAVTGARRARGLQPGACRSRAARSGLRAPGASSARRPQPTSSSREEGEGDPGGGDRSLKGRDAVCPGPGCRSRAAELRTGSAGCPDCPGHFQFSRFQESNARSGDSDGITTPLTASRGVKARSALKL